MELIDKLKAIEKATETILKKNKIVPQVIYNSKNSYTLNDIQRSAGNVPE